MRHSSHLRAEAALPTARSAQLAWALEADSLELNRESPAPTPPPARYFIKTNDSYNGGNHYLLMAKCQWSMMYFCKSKNTKSQVARREARKFLFAGEAGSGQESGS